jgi:hypothetical protein
MNTYVDLLMTNHKLESESSSDDVAQYYRSIAVGQKGGNAKNQKDILKHTSTGSFPPVYIATKQDIKKEEEMDKNRGFPKQNKTAVSIKEIMQERRDDVKPFFSL